MKMYKMSAAASALVLGVMMSGAAMAQDTTKMPDPSASPPVQTPDPATATPMPGQDATTQDTSTAQGNGVTVDTPTGPTQEVDKVPHKGSLASKAQLKREHARAIKAGDTANDPYSSESSDALNKAQLAKAQAMGTAPTSYPDQAVQGEGVAADPGATPADQTPQAQTQPVQPDPAQPAPDAQSEQKSPQ